MDLSDCSISRCCDKASDIDFLRRSGIVRIISVGHPQRYQVANLALPPAMEPSQRCLRSRTDFGDGHRGLYHWSLCDVRAHIAVSIH